jgi:hypothetical protein
MVTTNAGRLHREHFQVMVERRRMEAQYDTPEEMVEAYLQADWLVREWGRVEQMGVQDRERVRKYLLGVLRQSVAA